MCIDDCIDVVTLLVDFFLFCVFMWFEHVGVGCAVGEHGGGLTCESSDIILKHVVIFVVF